MDNDYDKFMIKMNSLLKKILLVIVCIATHTLQPVNFHLNISYHSSKNTKSEVSVIHWCSYIVINTTD